MLFSYNSSNNNKFSTLFFLNKVPTYNPPLTVGCRSVNSPEINWRIVSFLYLSLNRINSISCFNSLSPTLRKIVSLHNKFAAVFNRFPVRENCPVHIKQIMHKCSPQRQSVRTYVCLWLRGRMFNGNGVFPPTRACEMFTDEMS